MQQYWVGKTEGIPERRWENNSEMDIKINRIRM